MCHCIAALLTATLCAVLVASCAQTHEPRAELARTPDSQPTAPPQLVGPQPGGGVLVPTQQLIRPAGDAVAYEGRPVDLVVSPDGATLFVKDDRGLTVIDAASWRVRHRLKLPAGGGSMHGIAVSRDGSRVYLTNSSDALFEAEIAPAGGGQAKWGRKIVLAGQGGKGSSYPCGVCLTPNGRRALVCLSMNNTLAVVDLFAWKLEKEIPVGVAPFDAAVTADGRTAYVSNWGGRRPRAGEPTTRSAGTNVVVDPRGIGASGSVSVVDVDGGRQTAQVETGLHPSDVALSADERRLYVANANSDTVSVVGVDRGGARVLETISVRPDPGLPFGSAPNGLAIGPDGQSLFVALGGNNAVAVVSLAAKAGGKSEVKGFVPAGWYPGAVAVSGQTIYVANVKGVGSRAESTTQPVAAKGRHVKNFLGTVTRFAPPSPGELEGYTRQVRTDARVPEALRAIEKADAAKQGGTPPVPVPARLGEPSVFDHVVYVIKENRTYDQVFGDIKSGNGDPRLCIFGRDVTPNHHALAEQFVLLDNFYCNGVVSADGHAWATEGFVTDYFEKAFGGFTRVYFAGDALSFSPTGFIWDNVLLHGLSFRNYGEKDFPTTVPPAATFKDIYSDFTKGGGKVRIVNKFSLDPLKPYSAPGYAGWNLKIPDVVRADVFLKELAHYDQAGGWPNFMTVYLPNDHTNGTSPNQATPRAMVADNDLALGRIVEAVSHSKYWPTTCIFVIEDDPQAGFDHVDGHRSLCLVISPYTKRGQTVSTFYNQTAVLHTMEQMLGLPPMNQMDAMSPLMGGCFQEKPDLTPYTVRPNKVPLDEMNRRVADLRGEDRHWAEASLAQYVAEPDRADDDTMNRVLWHSVRGDAPYPAALAGAHGKGLKAAGLKLDHPGRAGRDDDDD